MSKIVKAAGSVLRVSKNVSKYFPRYIGQPDLLLEIAGVIDGLKENANLPLPKYALDGIAGAGKTELCKAIAKALAPEGFAFVEIHCHVTLPEFLTIWTQSIEGKKVIIFIDEVHDFKNPKVKNLLKRILETGGEVATIPADATTHITPNPFQHFWVVASNMETTDAALFGASGRFERKTLMPLSEAEVAQCMRQMAEDVHLSLHADSVKYLTGYVMANPRAIRTMVQDILRRVRGGSVPIEAAREIVRLAKRYPGGYMQQDINILRAIAKVGERGQQVAVIAAGCGGADPKVIGQRIRELEGEGLISTTTAGRKQLAKGGVELLKKLAALAEAAKRKLEAAKGGGKAKPEAKEKPEAKPEVATAK